jgi:hypothetical protein
MYTNSLEVKEDFNKTNQLNSKVCMIFLNKFEVIILIITISNLTYYILLIKYLYYYYYYFFFLKVTIAELDFYLFFQLVEKLKNVCIFIIIIFYIIFK